MTLVRSRILAAIAVCLAYLIGGSSANAGTLMPPGEVTFFDNNGLPLSAGCIFFYVPGTFSPKATYQNSAQTIANTNPVTLDAAGRAVIYGTGTYRQVVNAVGANGNCAPPGAQIWDQLTASTDSSGTIYAGASSGTPNAITVTAPAFSGTDGQVINYISTNTNTGGATINPSGFGAVQIVRDSSTGPAALTGGELVATNAVSLIYDATAGTFHILSPVTWPAASGVPVGSVMPFAGFSAPTGYAFAYGQPISRTTFASLLTAYTSVQTASLSSGSPTITGLSDTTQFARGQAIEAVGIPASTTILSCTSTACILSANATATRSGSVTFFAYGDGDGTSTFNLPDYRGRTLFGRDNMGGTAANISQTVVQLTTVNGSATATVDSNGGLSPGMTITGNANVPSGTKVSTISGLTITMSNTATASQSNVSTRFSVFPDADGLGVAGGAQVHGLTLAEIPTGITSANASQNISVNLSNFGSPVAASGSNAVGNGTPGSLSGLSNPVVGAIFSAINSISVISNNTGGNPHSIVPTGANVNWAVKLTP